MTLALSDIPKWITERVDNELNTMTSDCKVAVVRRVLYASQKDQGVELIMMEIADGTYFVPAIFKANTIREKFGLSDLQLGSDSLEEKIIAIKTYFISAYRNNGSIYPYVIVTDFDNKRKRIRLADDLKYAHTNKSVEEWMNRVQQNIQNLQNPISKTYPSDGTDYVLKAKFPDLNVLESMLECILPLMYKLKARPPLKDRRKNKLALTEAQDSTKRRKTDQNDNKTEHAILQYQADVASRSNGLDKAQGCPNAEVSQQLTVVTFGNERSYPQIESNKIKPASSSESDHNAEESLSLLAHTPQIVDVSPLNSTLPTLLERMLSLFDDFDEIPDAVCIEKTIGSKVTKLKQQFDPNPRSPALPILSDKHITRGKEHTSIQVPQHLDSFKRRRFFSKLRLHYLL